MTPEYGILLSLVLPLWIAAGLLDWWCHRKSFIEKTTGLRESAFHLAMFAQIATGWVLATVLANNYFLLACLLALFILHEATTWLELRLVDGKRHVSPVEQMVHSFLELLPLAAIALLAVEAMRHAGTPDGWNAQWRDGLDMRGVALAVLCAGLLNLAPLLEEAARCLKGRRAHKAR